MLDVGVASLSKAWRFFLFSLTQRADFWCVFRPFSRGGNFGLHSTRLVYSSSYGRLPLTGTVSSRQIRYLRTRIISPAAILAGLCTSDSELLYSSGEKKIVISWTAETVENFLPPL